MDPTTLPDWIDEGEYRVLDLNDPVTRARYEEFLRQRNYPIAPPDTTEPGEPEE